MPPAQRAVRVGLRRARPSQANRSSAAALQQVVAVAVWPAAAGRALVRAPAPAVAVVVAAQAAVAQAVAQVAGMHATEPAPMGCPRSPTAACPRL